MNPSQLIAHLNALSIGDIDLIAGKLGIASDACRELGQDDLAERLIEARTALEAANPKEFRRLVASVVSRLGHLR